MPQKNAPKIALVGSGFLGLTLALRLANAGAKVTVFESASEIGGLASAWQIGSVVWDKHYHVTLLSDTHTRKIVEEIGLGDEFEWVETKTGFYTNGRLVSMSNTMEFLKFPPLGIISKLRLGGTIFLASKINDWKKLEKIPVEKWLTRLSGKKTFNKMWLPLLKAKLGEAYRETSAAFIWATIQRMYSARKSGLKKEMFGYVRGGYAQVLKRFGQTLHKKGVKIRLGTKVVEIANDSGKPSVTFADGTTERTEEFDKVIFTGPSNIAAKIIPQLAEEEKEKLCGIKYQGIVCASVLMKKSLSNFYVTNVTDETPFTGIIEMSALVDKKEFGGNALVYLPKYVAPDDKLFEKTDEEIRRIFLSALEKMYLDLHRSDVVEFKVSRVRQVFPIPVVDYSQKLPKIETSVSGVYVINSAHIVNGTLNVNETVQLAENFYKEYLEQDVKKGWDVDLRFPVRLVHPV
ncbi:MAG TPA: NAD(P)/FAD-dependent oxidoreductase [Pyrinomonadaceae bacterium]|jgi:protoporphyrinogen oxidase|nr:NAD(P)/FAD-dependent oxidoreductase [Pyrinomonadaceae bacterium]